MQITDELFVEIELKVIISIRNSDCAAVEHGAWIGFNCLAYMFSILCISSHMHILLHICSWEAAGGAVESYTNADVHQAWHPRRWQHLPVCLVSVSACNPRKWSGGRHWGGGRGCMIEEGEMRAQVWSQFLVAKLCDCKMRPQFLTGTCSTHAIYAKMSGAATI